MLRRWLACGLAAMFLAVAGVAHASGAGEKPATVTLSVERAPLATVLKKIEAQTYYTFFFNNELVGKAAPVTLSVKQAPVPDVLAKIFAGSDLTYEFREDKILIKRRNAGKSAAQAQAAGTVSDVGGQAARRGPSGLPPPGGRVAPPPVRLRRWFRASSGRCRTARRGRQRDRKGFARGSRHRK